MPPLLFATAGELMAPLNSAGISHHALIHCLLLSDLVNCELNGKWDDR